MKTPTLTQLPWALGDVRIEFSVVKSLEKLNNHLEDRSPKGSRERWHKTCPC